MKHAYLGVTLYLLLSLVPFVTEKAHPLIATLICSRRIDDFRHKVAIESFVSDTLAPSGGARWSSSREFTLRLVGDPYGPLNLRPF